MNSSEDKDLVILDDSANKDVTSPKVDDSLSNEVEEIVWDIDDVGEVDNTATVEAETEKSNVAFKVPRYEASFTGFLTEKEYSIETGKHIKNDCAPKRTCFNCLGDHNINECPEKKNFQAIARNKKNILGRKPSNVRYHAVAENKNSDCQPGQISDRLRKALGLREFEAPDFIYRMRVIGYSPGWLKAAEAKRADMSLFDGTGKALSHPDEEEGETDVSTIKYYPEKLISFPGFNTPFPDHIEDQHVQYGYPEMQEHHSKENFLRFMKMNRASKYKRKKLKASDTPQSSNPVKVSRDMDVDELQDDSVIEFNPPLPADDEKPPEPPKDKEDGELTEDSTEANKEPELGSAETPLSKRQKRGLESRELFSAETPSPTGQKRALETDSSSCDSPLPGSTPKRQHKSSSKGFTLGVSIPQSITPYDRLPESDKWTVDVSDHLLFVNLPDALGTWKKMRGIVKNVQGVMRDLHEDED